LIGGDFSGRLNAAVENAIILALTPIQIPAAQTSGGDE
jgi:hypothetical protein